MDLMEQIRLEATKYAAEFENACQSRDEDCGKIAPAFQSGAQALLNLLGRSATSEGHPPRVWTFCPECGSDEAGHNSSLEKSHRFCKKCGQEWFTDVDYMAVVRGKLSEHQALRAADLLEVEKLREELKFLQAENEVFGIAAEKYGDLSCCYDAEDVCGVVKNAFEELEEELSQEREARKGDSAEIARLRAELLECRGKS